MNRRAFLKLSGAVVAAVPLAKLGTLALPDDVFALPDEEWPAVIKPGPRIGDGLYRLRYVIANGFAGVYDNCTQVGRMKVTTADGILFAAWHVHAMGGSSILQPDFPLVTDKPPILSCDHQYISYMAAVDYDKGREHWVIGADRSGPYAARMDRPA